MRYEVDDKIDGINRHVEEIKLDLFRLVLNPTRDMALLIDRAENTIESLEADIEQIKIESQKG